MAVQTGNTRLAAGLPKHLIFLFCPSQKFSAGLPLPLYILPFKNHKMSAEDVFEGAIGIDLGTTYSLVHFTGLYPRDLLIG